MNKKWSKIILEVMVAILTLPVIIPLYFVVINSFKNSAEAAEMKMVLPTKLYIFANFKKVFIEADILRCLTNSTIITVFTVILVIITSSMTAFIFSRKKTKLLGILDFLVFAGLIVPPAIVPLFWILRVTKLSGTYLGIIFAFTAVVFSFSAILFKSFYNTISRQIDEAAIIDGCGIFSLFFKVIFPLLKPVTFTVFIIIFMTVWNDFSLVLYFLNSSDKYTLPLTVFYFFGMYKNEWNLVFTDIVLVAIPVVIIFVIGQKQIISGMTSGAIKG